jgi:hypothetical protein
MTFIVDDMSADNPPSAAALAAANACALSRPGALLAYPRGLNGGNVESLHLRSHVCSVQHMSVSALFGALSLSD